MASVNREPPSWTPAAAVGSVPLAIVMVAGFGVVGPGWALGAALLAVFFVLLLFALWAAPGTTRGFVAAVLTAGVTAVCLITALILLTAAADRLDVTRPGAGDGTTTTAVTPGATAPTP
jgi:hypothetical protein